MKKVSCALLVLGSLGVANAASSAVDGANVWFVVLPRFVCSGYMLTTAYFVFRRSLLGYWLGVVGLMLVATAVVTTPLFVLPKVHRYGVEAFVLGTAGLVVTGTWSGYTGLRKWKQMFRTDGVLVDGPNLRDLPK